MTDPIEDSRRDPATSRRFKIVAGVAAALVLIGILCLALGVPWWVIAIGIGAVVLFVVFEG